MSDEQPPVYVAYPRSNVIQTDAVRLQTLVDGFSGLCKVFYGSVLSFILIQCLVPKTEVAGYLDFPLLIFAVIYTGQYVGMIGDGLNWPKEKTNTARVLMGLNYLVCGFIGFVIFQSIMSNEFKKRQIRLSFLGVNKGDVERAIANQVGPPIIDLPPI